MQMKWMMCSDQAWESLFCLLRFRYQMRLRYAGISNHTFENLHNVHNSQGEYIAVEKVEGIYKLNPLIEQVWVYGNSFESSLVAVVVPFKEKIVEFASSGTDKSSMEALCADSHVVKKVLESMTQTAKAEKLKGFEIVKAIKLSPEPFSIEDDLLTPTFKLKRPQLQKKFQADLDALYASLKK